MAAERSAKDFESFFIEINESFIAKSYIIDIASHVDDEDEEENELRNNKIIDYMRLVDSLIRPLLIEKNVLHADSKFEDSDINIDECYPTKKQFYAEDVLIVFDITVFYDCI